MGFKQDWLTITFWVMTFGASVMGIASGALANVWAGSQGVGVSSTSVAAGAAGLCVLLVGVFWRENKISSQVTIPKAMLSACHTLTGEPHPCSQTFTAVLVEVTFEGLTELNGAGTCRLLCRQEYPAFRVWAKCCAFLYLCLLAAVDSNSCGQLFTQQ